MTAAGVRRCMRRCEPGDERCGSSLCLPDPEDLETTVCYSGGLRRAREPCETHYDCLFGGCNAAGYCAPTCGDDGYNPPTCARSTRNWDTTETFVCQDKVCTPSGG